jgi:hypothetical protein
MDNSIETRFPTSFKSFKDSQLEELEGKQIGGVIQYPESRISAALIAYYFNVSIVVTGFEMLDDEEVCKFERFINGGPMLLLIGKGNHYDTVLIKHSRKTERTMSNTMKLDFLRLMYTEELEYILEDWKGFFTYASRPNKENTRALDEINELFEKCLKWGHDGAYIPDLPQGLVIDTTRKDILWKHPEGSFGRLEMYKSLPPDAFDNRFGVQPIWREIGSLRTNEAKKFIKFKKNFEMYMQLWKRVWPNLRQRVSFDIYYNSS